MLIKILNTGEDKQYKFEDIEQKNKKIAKLNSQIANITAKTIAVLSELRQSLQEKNEILSKPI
jgi:hypothetical protein